MPTYTTGTVISSDSLNNREALRRFIAIGDLASLASVGGGVGAIIDYIIMPSATTIEKIDLLCPQAASSGTITIDILRATVSGGALTSLYTSNPKPSLTCAGGVSFVTSANIPNTTSLAANTVLAVRITAAPAGCRDLYVSIR